MRFPSKKEILMPNYEGSLRHTVRNFYASYDDYPGIEIALTDPKVAIHVVQKNGSFLKDLPDNFRDNKEVVSLAMQNDPFAFRYASEALKADKELVLSAVSAKPQLLEYAAPELKADKEVVLVAVKQDYKTLQYASEDLQNSVKEDGLSVLTKKTVVERMKNVLSKFSNTNNNTNSHTYGK